VLKTIVFLVVIVGFSFLPTVCVGNSEIKLISPIGAVSRSIIPGWGQIYTKHKLKGVFIFLSIGAFGAAGLQTDSIYRDYYNNKYTPAVLNDSEEAGFYFDKSNQYYKLSRFLLYTAGGIWAYSIIDSYVDANIYNARQQLKMLKIEDEKLKQLKQNDSLSYLYQNVPIELRPGYPILSLININLLSFDSFASIYTTRE
jgi:hypothetical protein